MRLPTQATRPIHYNDINNQVQALYLLPWQAQYGSRLGSLGSSSSTKTGANAALVSCSALGGARQGRRATTTTTQHYTDRHSGRGPRPKPVRRRREERERARAAFAAVLCARLLLLLLLHVCACRHALPFSLPHTRRRRCCCCSIQPLLHDPHLPHDARRGRARGQPPSRTVTADCATTTTHSDLQARAPNESAHLAKSCSVFELHSQTKAAYTASFSSDPFDCRAIRSTEACTYRDRVR